MSLDLRVLSLCDYTGAWSKPYRDAGYRVDQVDLKLGGDALLWPSAPSDTPRHPKGFADIRPLVGLYRVGLAAPVCTALANSGAKHPRTDDEIREALALCDACVRIFWALRVRTWVLENPKGKLARWYGEPVMRFQPSDYGDPYTKETCLWGEFNPPLKRPVEPVEGSKMWVRYGGKSERTKEARSKTPGGFAQAFFEANP